MLRHARSVYGGPLQGRAICIVAISNFVTFLENTQSYRRDLRRVEYGDERDPEQRAEAARHLAADAGFPRLKSPLFVVHGGNDPRVPDVGGRPDRQGGPRQAAPPGTSLGENEGHGFAKKENQDYRSGPA